jgi:hypothetical protein
MLYKFFLAPSSLYDIKTEWRISITFVYILSINWSLEVRFFLRLAL